MGLSARRIGIVLVGAFVVGLIAFLPAVWFETRINQALPAPWQVVMRGTVWDGTGVLRAGKAADSIQVPLTWTFDAASLATLRAAWNIVPASSALSGVLKVGMGLGAVEIGNAVLTLDAATLARTHPLTALLAPQGSIDISTPDGATITLQTRDDFRLNGEIRIDAKAFSIRPLGPSLAGDYTANLRTRDSRLAYTLRQPKGALNLDGTGTIDLPTRTVNYSGLVAPARELPDALLLQLKSIGKAEPDGRLRLDWKIQW